MNIRSQKDAIAAYVATVSDGVPKGYSIIANVVVDLSFVLEDGECLWSVALVPDDEANIIVGGESRFVGPDGKLWTFPSSPNFFDHEIAERALAVLYIEGVADLVDPRSLATQVATIVRQRDHAISGLADAARRGELREVLKGP